MGYHVGQGTNLWGPYYYVYKTVGRGRSKEEIVVGDHFYHKWSGSDSHQAQRKAMDYASELERKDIRKTMDRFRSPRMKRRSRSRSRSRRSRSRSRRR